VVQKVLEKVHSYNMNILKFCLTKHAMRHQYYIATHQCHLIWLICCDQ